MWLSFTRRTPCCVQNLCDFPDQPGEIMSSLQVRLRRGCAIGICASGVSVGFRVPPGGITTQTFARLGGGGEIERAQNRGIVGRPSYLDAISDVDHVPAILRDDENRRASVSRLSPQDLHKSLHGGSPACCGRGSCGPSVCGRGPYPFLTASPLSLARTIFLGTISPPPSLCPPRLHPNTPRWCLGGYFSDESMNIRFGHQRDARDWGIMTSRWTLAGQRVAITGSTKGE